MKKKNWVLFVLAVFFIFFLFLGNEFVFLSNSAYSDIPITHFPNLLYIQQTLLEHQQIPLWSTLIYAGTPFAANPLSGLWYLPGWLALLFPLPFGINLTFFLHLVFGVIGFYQLLRIRGRTPMAALFGGLSFFAGAKLISHFGAGHLSFIYAICWTPWLLFLSELSLKNITWKRFVGPGMVVGFIISADPRWIVPAGLMWVTFLFDLIKQYWGFTNESIKLFIKMVFSNLLIGLGISAGVWLPLIEFVRYSSRSALSVKDNLNYSLGFEKLFGLFFPDFGGFSEWVIYPSMIVLFLSFLSLFLYKENEKERIWFFIFVFAFIFSLGSALPFNSLLFELPLMNLLRVPARFFFICLFCMSVLASFGFDYLLAGLRDYKFDRLFFLTPIAAFITIFFVGVSFLTQGIKLNFLWSFIFAGLCFLVIAFSIHNRLSGNVLAGILFLLLFFDVMGVNYLSLDFRSKKAVLNTDPALYQQLSLDAPRRIYTPSYTITQEEAAYWGIRQVNGIDPMQLTSYVNYFSAASGVPLPEYSVTLPAFTDGEPHQVNQLYCPDVKRLEKLSVQLIVSNFSMAKCKGLNVSDIRDNRYFYEINPVWAWISTSEGDEVINLEEITFLTYSPNRIKFRMEEQGMLTVSEIYYPGWQVFVNGQKQPMVQAGIFRSFYLPEEINEVNMIFRPFLVYGGLICEVLTWMVIGLLWNQRKR